MLFEQGVLTKEVIIEIMPDDVAEPDGEWFTVAISVSGELASTAPGGAVCNVTIVDSTVPTRNVTVKPIHQIHDSADPWLPVHLARADGDAAPLHVSVRLVGQNCTTQSE